MDSSILTSTNIIVALTCFVSFVLMNNRKGKSALLFHPMTISHHKQWHRFITSGFIHDGTMHLAINMFVLWSFGSAIEQMYYPHFFGEFSTATYLILYFGGIIVSSIPSYIRHKKNPSYAALGASGGVSAVVFAVIIFAPWDNLYLYGIIAIPKILAGVGYLIYSWLKDKKSNDRIGHMAHFTGAVWGFLFTGFLNPDLFVRFAELTLRGPSWL
ncbi:MAG: membrane associated rhomboid family serine protease [Candidatus Endobugula sp.]|jgi:membrane associated rhomboid family serine protease